MASDSPLLCRIITERFDLFQRSTAWLWRYTLAFPINGLRANPELSLELRGIGKFKQFFKSDCAELMVVYRFKRLSRLKARFVEATVGWFL